MSEPLQGASALAAPRTVRALAEQGTPEAAAMLLRMLGDEQTLLEVRGTEVMPETGCVMRDA